MMRFPRFPQRFYPGPGLRAGRVGGAFVGAQPAANAATPIGYYGPLPVIFTPPPATAPYPTAREAYLPPMGPPAWYLTATGRLGALMWDVTGVPELESFWLDRFIEDIDRWRTDMLKRADVRRAAGR